MDEDKLNWALDWAKRGFRIFPLRPGSKQPAIKGWPLAATRDEGQLRAWWSERDYNIGVLTDDLIVVDVDNKRGKNGYASLLELGIPFDDLDTLTTSSPSGGQHVYYTGPNSSLSVGRLGDGLDIRSYHGYVVGPGSYIDERVDPTSGCSGWYRVSNDARVRSAPAEVLSRLDRAMERHAGAALVDLDSDAAVDRAVYFLSKEAPAAVEGVGGDLQTLKVALWLRDDGVSEELAYDLILEHYNDRCFPPWGAEELRGKVANAYAYGSKPPGVNSPEHGFSGVTIPPPEPINRPPTIWFRHGDDYEVDTNWLYYELLPASGVCMLTAPSQAGKTFWLVELARSLATGKPFFDIEPDEKGGTIFLFSGTEGTGLARRLAALQEDGPLAISATRVSGLGQMGALGTVVEQVREEAARMLELHGIPLRLVILETLSSSGLLEDEDSNAEAANAINNLAQLGTFLGVPVLTSHHPPKSGQGSRGAGAIINNADVHIEIDRHGSESVRTVWVRKAREASQRRLGAFSLLPVDLGEDSRGRKVVSMSLSTGVVDLGAGPKEAHTALLLECVSWVADVDSPMLIDGTATAPYDDVHELFKERKPGSKDRGNVSRAWTASLNHAVANGVLEDLAHGGARYLRRKEIIV